MQLQSITTSTDSEEGHYFLLNDLKQISTGSYPQPYQKTPSAFDSLLAASEQASFAPHGQDTLTIGNQERWIRAKGVRRISYGKEAKYIDYLPASSTLPHVYYRNAKQVRGFLAKHSHIAPFLQVVWPTLIKYFGKDTEVYLELLDYPEAMTYPELVAWIQCSESVEDGLQKLDAFEDELSENNLHNVSPHFNFNIEFK